MKKAIICVGVSASGKSTFANKWTLESPLTRHEINRDTLRVELMGLDGNEFSWDKWNWKREKEVTELCNDLIDAYAMQRCDIIISDTNLNKVRREQLTKKLESYGYEVEIKDFYVTWEDAVKRDNARRNGVGQSVLAGQFDQWNEYIGRRTYTPDVTKPKAVMCDLDGTLCEMVDRGPFEWLKVGQDNPNIVLVDILKLMRDSGVKLIFMSGRDSVCRRETTIWLNEHIGSDFELFMRAENDMRKDSIIKEELFWQHVDGEFNVIAVFDDRPQVCDLWNDLKLKLFALGDQRIRF